MFGSSQDMVVGQLLDMAVKKHRVHKYAGKDLLTKRQISAQEGAKKSRQDALLEKRHLQIIYSMDKLNLLS